MRIIARKYLNITTPSCHASTIAFYNNKPIYAWFGGSMEGGSDVAIYVQYDDRTIIFKRGTIAHWNPILFTHEDKLFLSFKIGRFCDSWATLILDISDVFESDFNPDKVKHQIIPAGLNFCTKTKPIIYGNLIYCGSSVETVVDWTSFIEVWILENNEFKYIDRSCPLTVSKKIYQDPYYGKRMTMGIIQPSLWTDHKSKYVPLKAFFRSSRGLGKIYYSSASTDSFGTLCWSKPEPTKLDNPNSGIDIVYTKDRLFLVHNPSDTYRYPLVVSELDDNFEVIDELVIREKVDGQTNSPELSYPYMVEHDGNLHLVYTMGRSKIENVTIGI